MINIWELSEGERSSIADSSIHSNLYYNSTNKMLAIFKILPVHLKKYRKEMLCILTNTARAIKFKAKYIAILRDRKFYEDQPQGISHRKMLALQELLEQEGYISIYRGGIVSWEWGEIGTCTSYLELKEPLTSLFKEVNIDTLLKVAELLQSDEVIIKDRATKEIKSTRGVEGVAEIKSKVREYNMKLLSTSFNIQGKDIPSPQFFRSFNDDLEHGGRWYERGSSIQTKPQIERKTLMINNEETVMLDLKALHPSLCYEMQYTDTPELVEDWIEDAHEGKYDPYPSYLPFLILNFEKIEEIKEKYNPKYNPVRNLCKYALMVALNARSSSSAQKALITEYKKECKAISEGSIDLSKAKYYGIEYDKVFHASKVLLYVEGHNQPISSYLYQDLGVKLQNIESCIMSKVIDRMITLDYDALIPEHDGVIVKRSDKEECKKSIREAYKEVMQSDKFCIIEEK